MSGKGLWFFPLSFLGFFLGHFCGLYTLSSASQEGCRFHPERRYLYVGYDGENEFRIGTYYEEANCIAEEIKGEFQFGKTMMLDVKRCLEAIFISSSANLKQKNDLLEYAEKLNVPIIEMVWKHDSFQPIDYKQQVDFYKNLNITVTGS